jgi:1,4-dihydroxy-2-naphthoyl-CoA hydrolase
MKAPMDALTRLNEGMLPFAALLGVTFTGAEPDRVTAEMTVRDDLCTRPAVLHGARSWPSPTLSERRARS